MNVETIFCKYSSKSKECIWIIIFS